MRPDEVEAIFDHLKQLGKKAEKQLRWWHGNAEVCPFLTKDATCFIYPVRPSVCRAFGHIQFQEEERKKLAELFGLVDLTCPWQLKGKTRFDPWTDEQIVRFGQEQRVTDPRTRVVILAMFGREVLRALKTGVLNVPYFTSEQWTTILAKVREARRCSMATSTARTVVGQRSRMG